MRTFTKLFIFAAAILPCFSQASSSLPMPERVAGGKAFPYEGIRMEVNELNRYVGTWPPSFSSENQREDVYKKWSAVLQKAWALEDSAKDSEKSLYILSELFRQGHNMDVEGAGFRANASIERCLKLYSESVDCHSSASYFYLTVHPKFAPKGEESLRFLRSRFAPKVDMTVERGFVFAYLYQGKNDEAIKQLEYILSLDPSADWARKILDGIRSGKGKMIAK